MRLSVAAAGCSALAFDAAFDAGHCGVAIRGQSLAAFALGLTVKPAADLQVP